jgi:predicted XRE-type DNA-binding protein
MTDRDLIKEFIAWAIRNDLNQSGMARAAGRSRGWASYLIKGKIQRLRFDTRNRIITVLENSNAASDRS